MDALMSLTLIGAADGSHARFIGHKPGTEVRRRGNGHLWSQADCGIFCPGSFLKEKELGPNLH